MDTQMLVRKIRNLLPGEGQQSLGLLVTADGKGRPHATYMGTMASADYDRLLTMTAPDSRKVCNILENPQVEWLFLDADKDEVLYLRGTARVIQEPDEVARAWASMTDKSRAYFLSYQETVGMNFLIFETDVEVFEFRAPKTNDVYRLQRADLQKLVA